MKLFINKVGDREVARVEFVVNELTGEKKVFKGWLDNVNSNGKSFKACELKIDNSVDEFGRYVKK